MPFNVPGILAPLHLLFNPRLIVPNVIVPDIRYLNFAALKNAGYRGAVFDKDNCLTLPEEDTLIPDLKDAWATCRSVFGDKNVIVVSNTAGSHIDDGRIQAESVSHYLGVPVLFHRSLKPSYSCAADIRKYFANLPDPIEPGDLVVVGDRLFTDVVLARRLHRRPWLSSKRVPTKPEKDAVREPLAVWTSHVWKRDATLMRWGERGILRLVERWFTDGSPRDSGSFVQDPSLLSRL